jgi:hypothetical protein
VELRCDALERGSEGESKSEKMVSRPPVDD